MESDVEMEREADAEGGRCCSCCLPCCRCSRCCRKKRKGEGGHVAVQMPKDEPDGPTRTEKCCNCCKKFTAFLFSTIGLCSLMVAYIILGGFIFVKLEGPAEKKIKHTVQQDRRRHVERLWDMTERMNVFYKENWTAEAEVILKELTDKVWLATKKHGWDGNDGDAEIMWTFAGSLLYSITVITTIGYGHISPKTDWGRVVTLLYAIIGIPITLLCLANLGGFMATAFRYLYKNIICGLCCICCRKKNDPAVRQAALKYMDVKNGEPGITRALTSPEEELPGSVENSPQKKLPTSLYLRIKARQALGGTEELQRQTVPIPVSLFVITLYILGGALLFSMWEGWEFLTGAYFTFITLTTIGFGDVVPGTGADSWSQQEKLILCSIYLVFGLALIAMCFELMQEEVRHKCRQLAKKIGLIK